MYICSVIINETNAMKNQIVTLYVKNEFFGNINKIEGRMINYGTRPFAQYAAAPFIDIIPKGKRKPRRYMQTYNPFMFVVSGSGHPDPKSMLGEPTVSGSGIVIRQSRFSSFDDRFVSEFNEIADAIVAQNPEIVIMDFREVSGTKFKKMEAAA